MPSNLREVLIEKGIASLLLDSGQRVYMPGPDNPGTIMIFDSTPNPEKELSDAAD